MESRTVLHVVPVRDGKESVSDGVGRRNPHQMRKRQTVRRGSLVRNPSLLVLDRSTVRRNSRGADLANPEFLNFAYVLFVCEDK